MNKNTGTVPKYTVSRTIFSFMECHYLRIILHFLSSLAGIDTICLRRSVEMVDKQRSERCIRKGVKVRVLSPAPQMEKDSRYSRNSFKNRVAPFAVVFGMGLGIAGYSHAQEQAMSQPQTASLDGSPILLDTSLPAVTFSTFDVRAEKLASDKKYCRKDIELSIKLDWPVNGATTKLCDPDHYGAIDLAATYGTDVKTAAEGTVVFVGGNPCCSYGYHVIVDHGDGLRTLYAHLQGFDTAIDSRVEKDEVIGRVGTTGNTKGPHLHFEVKKGDEFLDPRAYLP